MAGKKNTRKTGARYEKLAADYLAAKGYRILERNYHAGRFGELDLLAEQGGTLIVCECKYRSGASSGDPLEAVHPGKQRQICRTLLSYLARRGLGADHPCRFDVIAVYGDGAIRHVENAFEFQI